MFFFKENFIELERDVQLELAEWETKRLLLLLQLFYLLNQLLF